MPTATRMRRQGQKVNLVVNKQSTTAVVPSVVAATLQTATATTSAQGHNVKPTTELAQDQAWMNLQQSNLIVKTMLDATFGCMTFLRGLLPDGNFEDVHVAAPNPGPCPCPVGGHDARRTGHEYASAAAAAASQMSNASNTAAGGGESQGKSSGKGLRIKKIKRGYSTEADKLLDWIDGGIMEAVEKQYLKSCVFAVYLDPEDPTNLVEALTINFYYPELDDSGIKIPQFHIEDSIQNLRIGGTDGLMTTTTTGKQEDGAAGKRDSARAPDGMRLRTVGEVKKAIKKLIKSLIITCQSLGELPTRRWVTMRLHYLDETPADYEPPFFVPVRSKQDLHFGTKNASQVPDKTAVGHLETGFHSLSMKLTSIADLLPRVMDVQEEEDCYGRFSVKAGGTATDGSYNLGKRRRAEESLQRSDAAKRRVIWNALEAIDDRADIDPAYQDAEGEPDSQVPTKNPHSPSSTRPMGVRQPDGTILPYATPSSANVPPVDGGHEKDVRSSQLDPTYVSRGREKVGGGVQDEDWPMITGRNDEGRGVGCDGAGLDDMEAVVPMTSGVFPDADPGLQDPVEYMHETPPDRAGDKTTAMEDSIASFADTQNKADGVPDIEPVQSAVDQGASSHTADKENHMDANEPVEKTCPCAAEQEDEIMVECEGCATWFHMPCAGYLEEEDLPDKYYCIICKMKTAGHFSKAKMDEAQSYLPSLTLERRALKKIYKKKKFENTNNMMREIGCDANDFRNLLERLLGSGLLKTEVTQVIRKVNQNASRKFNVTTYHAQVGAQDRKRYGDYFKPGGAIELKAVGITASMLRKDHTCKTQESKRMASPSAKAEGGKENVARQTRETRSTMHKTLPFAKGPVRAEKGRPIAKESRPEAGKNTPPRTELARPTIPLPKSKPREKPANHLTGETRAGGKGLFRTAASVLVQPLAEGEDREQSEADVISKAAEECDGQPRPNKASAPEEDVDMGV